MRLTTKLLLTAALATQLSACIPVVVGGAAAGGAMVADRRTSGTYIEDEGIEIKAEKSINDNIGIANIHVNVTSYNRNVLITGEALTEAIKAKAEQVVKTIDNVRSITNELTVEEKSTLPQRNNDAYITSKVKARMVKENRFPTNYVKVITEGGIVYLMGIVSHQEAADAVDIASNTSDVQKVVKVFEYTD
ncbi:transporter [Methylovorus sp. MM2]|uniref:BON domain-containing protein n=1 Tax=Methylovorus sp. MM2 TaxID=1848038 RepID=UPI0007DF3214|nr:BON domain-containing protein [Methylovorus sp. MM2]OAM52310.1 transporter [Methylovorus sp. MM2]